MSQIPGHHYGKAFRAFLWTWCGLGISALLFIGIHISIQDTPLGERLLPFVAASVVILGLVLYSTPSMLACISEHPRRKELYWVNWLLGWTVVGWIATLIWAYVGFKARRAFLKDAPLVLPVKAEEDERIVLTPAEISVPAPVELLVSRAPEAPLFPRVHIEENSEADFRCPKCSESIQPTAIICHYCQFEIGEYRDNFSLRKITTMVRSSKDHRNLWLKDKYKKEPSNYSFMWILYVLVGIVMCFVPVVGWILAPAMFFWAFVTLVVSLIAPVRGTILLNYLMDKDTYRADQAMAEGRSRNTYIEATCPACDYGIASRKDNRLYSWPDEKVRQVKCPGCEKVSTRIHDVLLWIPYPSVSLKGSFREYLPSEQSSVASQYASDGAGNN